MILSQSYSYRPVKLQIDSLLQGFIYVSMTQWPGWIKHIEPPLRTACAGGTSRKVVFRTWDISPRFVFLIVSVHTMFRSFLVAWFSYSPMEESSCRTIGPHQFSFMMQITESNPGQLLSWSSTGSITTFFYILHNVSVQLA